MSGTFDWDDWVRNGPLQGAIFSAVAVDFLPRGLALIGGGAGVA